MAGYMYLGNQKVCPAILLGGGETWYNPEHFSIRFPDGVKSISTRISCEIPSSYAVDFDMNEVETISGAISGYILSERSVGKVNLSSIKKITGSMSMYDLFDMAAFTDGFPTLDSLEEISGYLGAGQLFINSNFSGSYRFEKLNVLTGSMALFGAFGETDVTDIYFDALESGSFGSTNKDQLSYIFWNNSGCTLHFPSNLSSVIPTLDGYPDFGGTNTVILYDLPSTEGA